MGFRKDRDTLIKIRKNGLMAKKYGNEWLEAPRRKRTGRQGVMLESYKLKQAPCACLSSGKDKHHRIPGLSGGKGP